jgi:hypothetical protein
MAAVLAQFTRTRALEFDFDEFGISVVDAHREAALQVGQQKVERR